MGLEEHLKSRHLDIDLHRPIIDNEEGTATFYLWNMSGKIVGFHQYRPSADKTRTNDPKDGRYYTYKKAGTIAVWGLESLYNGHGPVFVTEGIFDAARLTEKGCSAIAVLSNKPSLDVGNWLACIPRPVVVVCDNDKAGKALAAYGDYAVFTEDKDLGDSSEEFVCNLIRSWL